MGAHDRALAAVDADSGSQIGISAAIAASPPGGARRERAVGRERAHREEVAVAGEHPRRDALDEVGGVGGTLGAR